MSSECWHGWADAFYSTLYIVHQFITVSIKILTECKFSVCPLHHENEIPTNDKSAFKHLSTPQLHLLTALLFVLVRQCVFWDSQTLWQSVDSGAHLPTALTADRNVQNAGGRWECLCCLSASISISRLLLIRVTAHNLVCNGSNRPLQSKSRHLPQTNWFSAIKCKLFKAL